MPRIFVDLGRMREIGSQCEASSKRIDTICSDIKTAVKQLDWDVRANSDVSNRSVQISKKLDCYSQSLRKYKNFIDFAYQNYVELCNYEFELTSDVQQTTNTEPANTNDGSPSWLDKLKILLEGIQGAKGDGIPGGVTNLLLYIYSFVSFFTGDKIGWTGASDWCDLGSSSCNIYKWLIEHVRGEGASSGIVGLIGSLFGLGSGLLSASDGLDSKEYYDLIADYTDCLKPTVGVGSSIYELVNGGLTKIKAGPWSALEVWKIVANSGIEAFEQLIRSIGEYSADGQWDVGDTAETCIDTAMAGIYGIANAGTLGLADLIFGAIDGGAKPADMTYIQEAAVGFKILGEKVGTAIGNWWKGIIS